MPVRSMMAMANARRNVPDQAEFQSLTLFKIGVRFYNHIRETIDWCRQYGLLANTMQCPTCNINCMEGMYFRAIDGVCWRCPECRKTINIRKGSFFEQSHLHLWQLISLTYYWSVDCGTTRGFSQDQIMKELEIGSAHSIVDWKQFCRDVCVDYFLNHPEQLGGPGRVVEIDESLFSRRKYNRGQLVRGQWVFGGYDPQEKKGFLIPVARRDAGTLIPIIQQWIVPGSTIHSDMWAAYNQIGNIGYQHGTVNHTYNFVDPQTGVHTNRVEAMWMRAKNKFKAHHGATNRHMILDYMAEFMWMQRFGDMTFFHFWRQIAEELYIV